MANVALMAWFSGTFSNQSTLGNIIHQHISYMVASIMRYGKGLAACMVDQHIP